MSVALWLLDVGDTLRTMARSYTDDANDVHLLTHGAIVVLLRQKDVATPPSEGALAAALTVSAQQLAASEEAAAPMVSSRHLAWTSPAP